ncbi:hypothetical protein RhiLY_01371 [Ceratobasidium sp. AG-Ba]|nr:hypothetical protein RhiLY_01371 [Ceratobasidium sp. AG-Ba]
MTKRTAPATNGENEDTTETVELPPREQTSNRAKANGKQKRAPRSTQPVALTLAGQRSRRVNVTEKAYYKDKAPVPVVRREPTTQVAVPHLDGQEDIPSSDDDPFAPRRVQDSRVSMLSEALQPQLNSSISQPDASPKLSGDHHLVGLVSEFALVESQPQPQPFPNISSSSSQNLFSNMPNPYDFNNPDWNHFSTANDHPVTSGLALPSTEAHAPQYVVSGFPASTASDLNTISPSYSFPSYTRQTASQEPLGDATGPTVASSPTSTPLRRGPTSALRIRGKGANKKVSSKTPQKKLMRANAAAQYAAQRRRIQQSAGATTNNTSQVTPNKSARTRPSLSSVHLTADQQELSLAMRKFIGFHLLTRSAWLVDCTPVHKAALDYAKNLPRHSGIGNVEVDNLFGRLLRLKESALRGEFVEVIKPYVKDDYKVSASTTQRIDDLIKKDKFVYKNACITSRKEPGFFLHDGLSRVIAELCADDPKKKWHAKAKDKSATKGAPVGLLAFRCRCECIRDQDASNRKPYKFEHARYGTTWERYRKELIQFKHLGALRRDHLDSIKQRYNESNRVADSTEADSDVDMDSDDVGDISSGYESDEVPDVTRPKEVPTMSMMRLTRV